MRSARLSSIHTLGLGYKLCEVIAHCAPLPLSRFRTTSPMNTTSAPSNHEPEGITHDLTSPSEHEPRKIVNQDITYIASPKMSQESDNKPSATAGRDPPRQLWFKPHADIRHPVLCAATGVPGELDITPRANSRGLGKRDSGLDACSPPISFANSHGLGEQKATPYHMPADMSPLMHCLLYTSPSPRD